MLTKIREKSTGIFAWVIVTIITVPFALWGINSYFEGGGEALVASAEGVDIDLNTYQAALAERRRVTAQVFQQNIDPTIFESKEFKMQVLDGLINNASEASFAERTGYRISEEQLGATIRVLPYFQNNGVFDSAQYANTIRNAGMSVARFEQQQRQQIVNEQIRAAYIDSVVISNAEVDRVVQLLEQTRAADYVVLGSDDSVVDISVSEDEIRSEYDLNNSKYFAPEQVKVEYLELSRKSIADNIELREAEIEKAFEDNKARFTNPETRRVSHILIGVSADASEAEISQAEQKAVDLVGRVQQGANFAELAMYYSDDSGSAEKGGDLGVLTKGVMVPPFEEAAYALRTVGETSEPVRSRFGFHIIQLTDFQPELIKSYDEARGEIEAELRAELAEEQFIELAEAFSNTVYENPESLVPAADEVQLSVMTSDWFSRDSGNGIAKHEIFRHVAFSDEVRAEGLNSNSFEIDSSTMLALRSLDYRSSSLRPFEDVRNEIESSLLQQRRSAAIAKAGSNLLKSIKNSTNWDSVVEENDLDSVYYDGGRNDAADPTEQELVTALFTVSGVDLPYYGGIETDSGEYILFRLNTVVDGNLTEIDNAVRESIRARIVRYHGQTVYQGYQQQLRAESEVTIFEENL